jgi:uncharacterized membrane protein
MRHPFFGPAYHHGVWPGVIGLIFWVAFMALIIMAVIWLVNGARHGHNHLHHAAFHGSLPAAPPAAEDAALKEARMRYARGELTRKQFLEISADLGGPAQQEATPPA